MAQVNPLTGSGRTSPAEAGSSGLLALVRATHQDADVLLEQAGQELAGLFEPGGPQGARTVPSTPRERELEPPGRQLGPGELKLGAREPEPGPPSADPRQTLHANDAAVAALSAHLSVMERVVYPTAAAAVPRGRERAAGLRRLAREAAHLMRGLEQYVQGDRYHPASGPTELLDELAELLHGHARAEENLLRELEERLGAPALAGLRGDVETAMRHAPTRPHPYLGHRAGGLSRLAGRAAGAWDHVLDMFDSRAVAGRPVRAPAPAGLWGWYLLGRPTADQVPPGSAVDVQAGEEVDRRPVSGGT